MKGDHLLLHGADLCLQLPLLRLTLGRGRTELVHARLAFVLQRLLQLRLAIRDSSGGSML